MARTNFSADSWSSTFEEYIWWWAKKNKAGNSGIATDFIFNVWTRISAAWLSSEWAWDTCAIWLEIQEI